MGFAEVSGLTVETQAIEYRDGMMPETSPLKMPGIQKFSNLTLKRGILAEDNEFAEWLTSNVGVAAVNRRTITITLHNEEGQPVMIWRAKEAWPVKVEGPGLKATGNEVAIESIEIAHEGLQIELP